MGSVNSHHKPKRRGKKKKNGDAFKESITTVSSTDSQEPERHIQEFSLLPCVRHGEDRWWLPCKPATMLLLAELLTRRNDELSADFHKRVVEVLRNSPPLYVFCLFNFTCGRPFDEQTHVCIEDLADWLENHFHQTTLEGEAFLGMPLITKELEHQWCRLYAFFQTLPFAKWPSNGHLWLETTGPTIPKKLRQHWSSLVGESEDTQTRLAETNVNKQSPNHLLESLTRRIRQLDRIAADFDKQVRIQKTEAIKQLAYGLSHEINNPLANISARAQQLARNESNPQRNESLRRISEQVYRAHEMIADLMFYANPPTMAGEQVDVELVAEEVIARYQRKAINKGIQLEFRRTSLEPTEKLRDKTSSHLASADLPFISDTVPQLDYVDKGMIGEAIGSLLRNSIEAISEQGRVEVSVTKGAEATIIEVADSGPGLSAEARRNAFDPYFCGREAGRGLGLGLCRVARIAELHGGTAEISGSIAGCIARITLPRRSPLTNCFEPLP